MTEENYCIVKYISSFAPARCACFDPEIGKPRHKRQGWGWGWGGGPPKMLCYFRVIDPRESG